MTDIKKFNKLIVMLIMSVMVVFGINEIIQMAQSASYIQSIISLFVAVLICCFIYDHNSVSGFILEKSTFSKVFFSILILIFFIFCASFVCYIATMIQKFFMDKSPVWYLLLFLLFPSVLGGFYGLKTVSGYCSIIWIFLVVSTGVIFVFCYGQYSINNLFPILGTGGAKLIVSSLDISLYGLIIIYFICISGFGISNKTARKNIFKILLISGVFSSAICLALNLVLPYNAVVYSDNAYLTLASCLNINFLLERSEIIVLLLWVFMCYTVISAITASSFFLIKKSIGLSDKKGIISAFLVIIYSLAVIFDVYNISEICVEISKYCVFSMSLFLPIISRLRGVFKK